MFSACEKIRPFFRWLKTKVWPVNNPSASHVFEFETAKLPKWQPHINLENAGMNLSAEVSPRRVKLVWTQPEGRNTFRIFRNNAPYGTGTGVTYWDSSVEPDTRYEYRVEALAGDQPAIVSETIHVKTPALNILRYELRAKIWRYGEPEPADWNVLSRQEQSWEVPGSSEES